MKKVAFGSLFLFLASPLVLAYSAWNVDVANYLAAKAIITDQSADVAKYRLDDTILRQEVIGMARKIAGANVQVDSYACRGYFQDTNFPFGHEDAWVCASVEWAADVGIVTRANQRFRPQDRITRAEALAILMQAAGITITKNVSISQDDRPINLVYSYRIPQWQIDLIESAHAWQLVDVYADASYPDQIFRPNELAKRSDVFGFAYSIMVQKDALQQPAVKQERTVTSENGYDTYVAADEEFRITYPSTFVIVKEEKQEDGYVAALAADGEISTGGTVSFEIARIACDTHCYDKYEEFVARLKVELEKG